MSFISWPRRSVFLTVCTAILLTLPTPAFAADLSTIPVRQPGDTLLTCEDLWNEAFAMKSIITRTRAMQDDSRIQNRGIGAAGAVATLLVGTATGGLGIGIAGFAAKEATEQKIQNAERLQETAQQRRALMAGIFMVKDCPGRIEKALNDVPERSTQDIVMAAIESEAGDDDGPRTRNMSAPSDRTAGFQAVHKGEMAGPPAPNAAKPHFNQ